jgi:hypothetical protein
MFVAAASGDPTPTPSAAVEEAALATEMYGRLLAEVYVQAGDAPNAARDMGRTLKVRRVGHISGNTGKLRFDDESCRNTSRQSMLLPGRG